MVFPLGIKKRKERNQNHINNENVLILMVFPDKLNK